MADYDFVIRYFGDNSKVEDWNVLAKLPNGLISVEADTYDQAVKLVLEKAFVFGSVAGFWLWNGDHCTIRNYPTYDRAMPVCEDTLKRLHKLNRHLLSAATEIEQLGANICDIGRISEKLQKRTGVTIWKLRDCCNTMADIQREEEKINEQFWQRHN